MQYSKERLTVAERLTRLHVEFRLIIGLVAMTCSALLYSPLIHARKSQLHELNMQFNIPSPCKPPPEDIATQAVLEKVAEDINQENGVNAITSCLSIEGMPLPRFVFFK